MHGTLFSSAAGSGYLEARKFLDYCFLPRLTIANSSTMFKAVTGVSGNSHKKYRTYQRALAAWLAARNNGEVEVRT